MARDSSSFFSDLAGLAGELYLTKEILYLPTFFKQKRFLSAGFWLRLSLVGGKVVFLWCLYIKLFTSGLIFALVLPIVWFALDFLLLFVLNYLLLIVMGLLYDWHGLLLILAGLGFLHINGIISVLEGEIGYLPDLVIEILFNVLLIWAAVNFVSNVLVWILQQAQYFVSGQVFRDPYEVRYGEGADQEQRKAWYSQQFQAIYDDAVALSRPKSAKQLKKEREQARKREEEIWHQQEELRAYWKKQREYEEEMYERQYEQDQRQYEEEQYQRAKFFQDSNQQYRRQQDGHKQQRREQEKWNEKFSRQDQHQRQQKQSELQKMLLAVHALYNLRYPCIPAPTYKELQRTRKLLLHKYHPDKATTPQQREEFTDTFILVNVGFDTLCKLYGLSR